MQKRHGEAQTPAILGTQDPGGCQIYADERGISEMGLHTLSVLLL